MAAYTGQKVAFDYLATQSEMNLFPENLAWDGSLPQPQYAIPGKTKLV